jgi:hypothetical protein
VRIVSTGELQQILREHAEDPAKGVGFWYGRLPSVVSGAVWEALSDSDRSLYEPDLDSMTVDPKPVGGTTGVLTGRYQRFVLPPGSYDAWMVSR